MLGPYCQTLAGCQCALCSRRVSCFSREGKSSQNQTPVAMVAGSVGNIIAVAVAVITAPKPRSRLIQDHCVAAKGS